MRIPIGNFNDFKPAAFFFQSRIPQFGESERLAHISDYTQLATFLKKPEEQLIDLLVICNLVAMARVRPIRSPIQWIVAGAWISRSVQDQQVHKSVPFASDYGCPCATPGLL